MTQVKKSGTNYVTAWHGTLWYALRHIVDSGCLLESDSSMHADHRCLWKEGKVMKGVYDTPSKACATGYAILQSIFKDGIFHRVVLEVLVNTRKKNPLCGPWLQAMGISK